MISAHAASAPDETIHRSRLRIALTVRMVGSLHRFTLLRRFLEQERDLACWWVPIYEWKPRRTRLLPAWLIARIHAVQQARAVFVDPTLDAVIFHAQTTFLVYTWYKALLRRRAISVWYRDDPPTFDSRMMAAYGRTPPTGPEGWIKRRLWRATFARANIIVARCGYTKRFLVERYGVPPGRVHVLHIGIDLDRWPRVTHPPRRPGRRVKLLFVGGWFWRKGGDTLVRVFREHFADSCELHLVTWKGAAHEALGQGAHIGPGEHIVIHEGIAADSPGMLDLYRTADIFVLPSRGDFVPFAILEAMASHLPVVSTTVGGIPELVDDGVTGYLVAPGDAQELRQAIQALIDDPERCLRMGAIGRERVEDSFDARVNVHRLADLIRECVAQRRCEQVRLG